MPYAVFLIQNSPMSLSFLLLDKHISSNIKTLDLNVDHNGSNSGLKGSLQVSKMAGLL